MPNTPFSATNSWCYHFARYEVLPEVLVSPEAVSGRAFRLIDVVKRLMSQHLSSEQLETKYARRETGNLQSVGATIKWYVPFISKNTRQLIAEGDGMFRLPSVGEVSDEARDAEEAEAALADMEEEEEEDDDFDGSVYAFTFDSLVHETNSFPIKIGRTTGDVEARVFGQCRTSAAFDRPKVLGQWKVNRVNAVESAIHQVLKARGLWREQALGAEWFDTRLEEIDKIVRFIAEA